ncbi:MAG: hypothetical protein QM489_06615 [Candidatus Izemoplasma sp.]
MNKVKYSLSMFLKVVTRFYFNRKYNVNYVYKGFSPQRRGPFFLIGNHVLLLDAFFANFAIKGYAIPVVNAIVYTNKIEKISMTIVIDSIVKRKGQSDITTIRNIRKFVKEGRSIQVYPEGNTSYYGNTGESLYSTAKLFKMQKIDVIVAKTKGGYFAKPRWRATRTFKPYVELEFKILFTVKELEIFTIDEIFETMIKAYYHNDYEWNKSRKHKYVGKDRLLGAHRVIYACPECNSINQITSESDSIICTNCNSKGTINDYGFIENTKFDNFVEWGNFQEDLLKLKLHEKYEIEVQYYQIDWKINKKVFISNAILMYEYGVFRIEYEDIIKEIIIIKIIGETYTETNQFSFDYERDTYLFITEKPKLLLDLVKFNKEEIL